MLLDLRSISRAQKSTVNIPGLVSCDLQTWGVLCEQSGFYDLPPCQKRFHLVKDASEAEYGVILETHGDEALNGDQ
jgi:hypothetical protein